MEKISSSSEEKSMIAEGEWLRRKRKWTNEQDQPK